MKFCCHRFEELFRSKGPGIVIRFSSPNSIFMCAIQSRCIVLGYEKEIVTKHKVIISTNEVINKCPFCGKNVNRYKKDHSDLYLDEGSLYQVGSTISPV